MNIKAPNGHAGAVTRFEGNCPLCGEKFMDAVLLETHASECNGGEQKSGTSTEGVPLQDITEEIGSAGAAPRKLPILDKKVINNSQPKADEIVGKLIAVGERQELESETQVWQEFEFDEAKVDEDEQPGNNPGDTVADNVKAKESKREANAGHPAKEKHGEYKLDKVARQDTCFMPMKEERCVVEIDEIVHQAKEKADVKETVVEEEVDQGLSQGLSQGLWLKLGMEKSNLREKFAWAIDQE